MRCLLLLPLVALAASLVSCESPGGFVSTTSTSSPSSSLSSDSHQIRGVKTTAYTHTEADHLKYADASAVGTPLKYGVVRSAAADWSVYPVGTVFQIDGEPYTYQIDDYGSALVGTNTIDLYKPTRAAMNDWGARNVNIKVIKWGSTTQSLAIMKDRQKNPHVKAMVQRLEASNS